MLAVTVLADPTVNQTSERKQKVEERTIFVTGSLIPQRVKLEPIGTKTVSPVRIIDRREIDQTGRRTTPGVLINEPSLRVIGHWTPIAELAEQAEVGGQVVNTRPARTKRLSIDSNFGCGRRDRLLAFGFERFV